MARARTPEAKDDRRKLLLKTALEEFYERGFSAARIDDIAERAGVSKGTVYLYFSSKDAIFLTLVEEMTSPNITQIEAIADSAPSVRVAIENFGKFGPHVLRETDLPKLTKVLIAESRSFPGIIAHYRSQVLDRLLNAIVRVLEQAKARGEIGFDDANVTARLIMAPMAFAGIWTGMFGKEGEAALDFEAFFAAHSRMTFKALQPEVKSSW